MFWLTDFWRWRSRWKRNRTRSNTFKVELYTRWSFHSFGGFEAGLIGVPALGAGGGRLGGWLFLLVCAHAGLCTVLQSRALDWRLGRRERPVRLLLGTAALSTAAVLTVLALLSTGAIPRNEDYAFLLTGFSGFGLASTALGLRTTAHMAYAVLGAAATTALAGLLFGLGAGSVLPHAIGVAASGTGLVFTYVFSAWLVHAVWELETARELATRLAVAEERLRFGRDLHDVMGRNLAVIALKSELAVQLAERGRPEAVAQMTEVQRIARESQREVRDVVRGYREADLRNELEGARGVLKAAGIDCRIEGDDGGALSAEVQSALGWVVREATTNVLRHGDARRCTVRLTAPAGQEERAAVLVVENDGAPDPAAAGAMAPARTGSGLAGLRERLAALDGTLEAGRTDDGRFRLTARVPLPAPGPAGSVSGDSVSGDSMSGHGSMSGDEVAA
ncbi:sensor histidine kinase [Streptomyces sp. AK02-01A]|uniref:sensor histidine kinase n=1 Tax=Streptomyces sp. AK02-01A TaxID=3028648 RepID=UPI0029B4F9EC|nr:histidine kinase [Streptomyces sp. AK02-01A]MDX3855026.1 histidine kinase [Streptomyces sp. AK02-01A]